MLLREFVVEDHVVSLIQENDIYIAKVTNKDNERILYNEYKDYEKVKNSFDEIVQAIETDNVNINDVIGILKKNQA
jgi:predicted DNA-binding ArsR family transcriptional regulator